MAKGIIPDEEKCDRFFVRVEAYYLTLKNARRKAELGSEDSSEEDIKGNGRGKRIKIPKSKKSMDSDKESTDSNKESNTTLTPPLSPKVSMSESERVKKGHCSENTEHNNVTLTSKPTLSMKKDQEPVIVIDVPNDANRVDETLLSGPDDMPIFMLNGN